MNHPSLDQLRQQFPDWDITVSWVTAATGPDYRHLVAERDGLVLTGHTAADLTAKIRQAEAE